MCNSHNTDPNEPTAEHSVIRGPIVPYLIAYALDIVDRDQPSTADILLALRILEANQGRFLWNDPKVAAAAVKARQRLRDDHVSGMRVRHLEEHARQAGGAS